MKRLTIILLTIPLLCMACGGRDDSPDKPIAAEERDVTKQQRIFLRSNSLLVRQDLTRGGAICFIADISTKENIVNIADEGRYIQQSYYAGRRVDRRAEGQGAAWSPWNWNPIQVGDYMRNRARILEAKASGSQSYIKCVPMLWDMNNRPAEAVMEQWTRVDGNTIYVKNRITCSRTDDIYGEGVMCDQEIPAVYPISKLKNLYTYNGSAPFTGDKLSQLTVNQLIMSEGGGGAWGRYSDITEQWMAFVNDKLWGMAVYSPTATSFLAGRSDSNTQGGPTSPSTSYIAPLRREALMKNSVMEYEYALIIDNLDNIRKRIYELRSPKAT